VFLDNSRYFNLKTVEAEDSKGRKVTAVTLRRLPFAEGAPTLVKSHDRLDVMAQRRYSDATKFWHIADSNTELEANDLLKQRSRLKEARIINVPEK
jgi:hypothetical protein